MERKMSSEEKQLFVIDTDAGLDDAQAILMALAAPHVEVIGITTVCGNTNAKQVSKNVLRLLKAVNKLEIPVYTGSERTIIGWQKPDDCNYHGNDGFGDVPDDDPPDYNLIQSKHGVQALIDLSKQYPGKLTLVALGPLTNLSLAIRLDPTFGERLKSCFIMGGNYKGEGNITPSAEFNFYTDPEAAHIVLSDLGCPITLVCWELCLEHSFPWTWHKELFNLDTDTAKFLKNLEKNTIENFYEKQNFENYELADQLAVAAAINPKIILKSSEVYCVVETKGTYTTGQVVVDWKNKLKEKPNVTILTSIDKLCVKNLILNAMKLK
ncbi:nucleoside hydrolase isoform X3 [Patella vulgata]|uniref:nucleoside hydrolase isoform X3 n=1 Tax=Patella vulgata TaxID=6465 RepID=UPI00217FFC81|nr:nucleoside hydrolase isoform X3 [Patella vulgata]